MRDAHHQANHTAIDISLYHQLMMVVRMDLSYLPVVSGTSLIKIRDIYPCFLSYIFGVFLYFLPWKSSCDLIDSSHEIFCPPPNLKSRYYQCQHIALQMVLLCFFVQILYKYFVKRGTKPSKFCLFSTVCGSGLVFTAQNITKQPEVSWSVSGTVGSREFCGEKGCWWVGLDLRESVIKLCVQLILCSIMCLHA